MVFCWVFFCWGACVGCWLCVTIDKWSQWGFTERGDEVDIEFVNLDVVAGLLRARGVECAVYMSGGGCGTLYLGVPDSEGFFPVAVGPAVYAHPDFGGACVASWAGLCYGRDGGSEAIYVDGARPVEQFVDEVVSFFESVKGA